MAGETAVNLADQLISDYLRSNFGMSGESYTYNLTPEVSKLVSPSGYFDPAQRDAVYAAIQQSAPDWFNQQLNTYKTAYGAGPSSITGTGPNAQLQYISSATPNDNQFMEWAGPASFAAGPFASAALAPYLGATGAAGTVGAATSALTGGNPLVGAVTGAAGSALGQALSGAPLPADTTYTVSAPGAEPGTVSVTTGQGDVAPGGGAPSDPIEALIQASNANPGATPAQLEQAVGAVNPAWLSPSASGAGGAGSQQDKGPLDDLTPQQPGEFGGPETPAGAGDVPQEPPLTGVNTTPTVVDTPPATPPAGGTPGWLDKLLSNPLALAGLGIGGAGLLKAGQKSSVPGQLTSLAGPLQAKAQQLIDQASTGPLASLPQTLIGQASTGPSATLASDLVTQSQTGPVATTANSLIEQYKTGQINPSDQFNIDRWKQAQIAAAKNYYAKAGIPDSSSAQSAIKNIEAQAVAMQDAARQGLLTQGLNAFNANRQLTSQAIQAQSLAQQLIGQGLNAEQVRQRLIAMGLSEDQAATSILQAAISAQAQQDQQFTTAAGNAMNALLLAQAVQTKTPAQATTPAKVA